MDYNTYWSEKVQPELDRIFEEISENLNNRECVSKCKEAYNYCVGWCPNPPDPSGCRRKCRETFKNCLEKCNSSTNTEELEKLLSKIDDIVEASYKDFS
ncbi:MAG: hypothetical protein AAF621_02975 [Pseudomonadota bacterium]